MLLYITGCLVVCYMGWLIWSIDVIVDLDDTNVD